MPLSPQAHASLYTAAEVRALDRLAIDGHGIPGIVLMQRAGRAAFRLACERFPAAAPWVVVCGTGNNGGDGFIVARLAVERGIPVRVLLVGEAERIGGDALLALQAARDAGLAVEVFEPAALAGAGLVVDALLGTGLGGAVRPAQAVAIEAINACGAPVLALDVPSGLCSDSGRALGVAVRADCTLSFIGRKRGLHTGEAAAYCGSLEFDDLAVPAAVHAALPAGAELLALAPLLAAFPPRARTAHKGRFGHVLVIGGDHGMGGAAALAAEAAVRCGAGLVSLATRPANAAIATQRRPEVMAKGLDHPHELEPLLARATVLVIGPGLGTGPWGEQLLQRALAAGLPTVLDADALNLLATRDIPLRRDHIVTPHPGEAARLLGLATAEVNADRFAALLGLLGRFPGGVVLKGAGSLVAVEDGLTGVCPYGNPGMASGGMGDVLGGMLGALLAQGLGAELALRLAVCVHGRAADLAAAAEGERGLAASDLLPWARRLLNGLEATR